MKHLLITIILALCANASWATDVGLSITMGDPGFYGRIDIGDLAPPRVVYREPVIVEQVVVVPDPIYLHVPSGHARHWKKHCHEYHACGRPVYLVDDGWYENVYVPHYRKQHSHKGGHHGHKGKHHGRRREH